MLEESRKKGASVFVYLIFCLLILIFVINFGPQRGQDGGCRGVSNSRITVDGKQTTESSWHVAYQNPYNQGRGRDHTYTALEMLIRRELLAQEAERRNLRVTDDMVMEAIKKGHFFFAGYRATIPGIFDEKGFWNQNVFRNFIGNLNVSRNSYVGEQQRGMLAWMMEQLLVDSLVVSREEALSHYLFENNTVQYDVVAFRPEAYAEAMRLTDADVERFLSTHESEVKAKYEADKRTWTGIKPQLQLREIFIAKLEEPKKEEPPPRAPAQGSGAGSASGSAAGSAAPATGSAAAGSAAPAAGSGAGSGSAVAKKEEPKKDVAKKDEPKKDATKAGDKPVEKKPVGMKIEDAKAKLEAVRTAAEKDKQKFIDAAKTLNTDENLKANAGAIGWIKQEEAGLGDKAVSEAVKTLKPGDMTPVITTDRGAYLILAEAKREGDLTYDQVKLELAKPIAKDVWSKEAAKRAALSAHTKAFEGKGLTLEQMYEKEQEPAQPTNPGIDLEQLMNDPNLPPEQKERIRQLIEQSQKSGANEIRWQKTPSGALVWESEDIPAAWKADQADGASGSAKPAGSAAPARKPAPPAAGSAATKPAAGSAATPAAGSATKPAPPATKPAAGSATTPAAGSAATKPAAGSAAPAAGSAAPAAGSAAPAAGSGAGSATPPTAGTPAPAASVELTPSSDKLPEFGEIKKPTVARFGPSPREGAMQGIGGSKEAAAALFDELTPGNLAKKVYEGEHGSYVVVQLISRSDPKVDEFEKEADRMIEELRAERGQAFVNQWLKERCEKLVKDDKIKPNPGVLRETDDAGKVLPVQYRPCMKF